MQSAMTISFGAVAMVTPTRDVDLTPTDWGRIDTATVWMGEGLKDQARALVREVEDEHGVTTADRRFARIVAQGLLIVPGPATAAINTGGPALFVDDGRSERVLVTSEAYPHPDSREMMRTASFLDQAGEEYEVKAACLAPCDDLFRALPLAPQVLETGKWAGVDRIAEPYKARPTSKAPVMDKFDRVSPIKPEDVKLDVASMSPGQLERMRKADDALVMAERRKHARSHIVRGRVRFGRMTPAEKAERLYAKEAYEALGQETAAANDRTEVSRGRVETLALENIRLSIARDQALAEHVAKMEGLDLAPGRLSHEIQKFKAKLESADADMVARMIRGQVDGGLHDGLSVLAARGQLGDKEETRRRFEDAQWYRKRWEAGQGSLRSCMADQSGSGGDGSSEDRRLKLIRQRDRVEGFIQAVAGKNGRMIQALRLVAGRGDTIQSLSPRSGANRALYLKALLQALDHIPEFRANRTAKG